MCGLKTQTLSSVGYLAEPTNLFHKSVWAVCAVSDCLSCWGTDGHVEPRFLLASFTRKSPDASTTCQTLSLGPDSSVMQGLLLTTPHEEKTARPDTRNSRARPRYRQLLGLGELSPGSSETDKSVGQRFPNRGPRQRQHSRVVRPRWELWHTSVPRRLFGYFWVRRTFGSLTSEAVVAAQPRSIG